MNLQVDVGNSFVKWRILSTDGRILCGRERTSSVVSMDGIDVWDKIGSISVSSVASGDIDGCLRAVFRQNLPGITPFFAKSQASFGGVFNAYKDPGQLGVDRWLGIIAGYSKYKESCLVVDCGSAITIDAIDDLGQHQGGYILPGVELMKGSLSSGTSNVEFGCGSGGGVEYGETTSECVQAGVGFTILSIFNGLRSKMKSEGIKRLIVTGGDGLYVKSLCSFVEYIPDLVFDGLSLVRGVGCDSDIM